MKIRSYVVVGAVVCLILCGKYALAAEPLTVAGCQSDYDAAAAAAQAHYQQMQQDYAARYAAELYQVKNSPTALQAENTKAYQSEYTAALDYASSTLNDALTDANRYGQSCVLVAGPGGDEDLDTASGKIAAAVIMHYYDYLDAHTYCDTTCAGVIKKMTGLTPAQQYAVDEKLASYETKFSIDNVKMILLNQTATTADYRVEYDFHSLVGASGGGVTLLSLIKVGSHWMFNYGSVVANKTLESKNYLAIAADIKKCQKIGPTTFTVPKTGGTFTITNTKNPLVGFSIGLPAVTDGFTLKIGCYSDLVEHVSGLNFISLPISIETSRPITWSYSTQTFTYTTPPLGAKPVELPKVVSISPHITIPYYPLISDDTKSLASAMSSHNKPGQQFVGIGGDVQINFGKFDVKKKLATFPVGSDLMNTWIMTSGGIEVPNK